MWTMNILTKPKKINIFKSTISRNFALIVAVDLNNGIGINNSIPWNHKKDMQHFIATTKKYKYVVVGYKTYVSMKLPKKDSRIFVCLTKKNLSNTDNVIFVKSVDEAIFVIGTNKYIVAGGDLTYNEFINRRLVSKIYLTRIYDTYDCDTYFTSTLNNFELTFEKKEFSETDCTILSFQIYETVLPKNQEYQYLDLLSTLLLQKKRLTRNGYTRSLFSPQNMKYDLSKGFPLLTTKHVSFKNVLSELLMFLSGETDTKKLSSLGNKIWEKNTSLDFMKKINLTYDTGVMGPMYGYQWRYYGSSYPNKQGFDQLTNLINSLIKEPESRRHVITTFNPSDVNKSVLMPCHGLTVQFNLRNENDNYLLDCTMYQRSADVFLGLPYNIASYSLLTYIVCLLIDGEGNINVSPGILTLCLGDAHIYESHTKQAIEQIKRLPYEFCTLKYTSTKKLTINDFDSFESSIQLMKNFKVNNYKHHEKINAEMVA